MSNTSDQTIRQRATGKIPTTSVTNELADAINGMRNPIRLGNADDRGWHRLFFFGKIVTTGPNGEDDLDPPMHWVSKSRVSNTNDWDDKTEFTEIDASLVPEHEIVAAFYMAAGNDGTQALDEGTPVVVMHAGTDWSDPPLNRYVIITGGAGGGTNLQLTSYTGPGFYAAKVLTGTATAAYMTGGIPTGMSASTTTAIWLNSLEQRGDSGQLVAAGWTVWGCVRIGATSDGTPIYAGGSLTPAPCAS